MIIIQATRSGEQVRIVIDGGHARAIYSDTIAPALSALGDVSIARASHVEPGKGTTWHADMGPVNGPVLGPFASRAEALTHEVAWLRSERGL